MQKGHLRPLPAEMQLGHAAGGEDAVRGIEHQPRLGDLQHGRAQPGILPAGIDQQGIAAQCQAQGHRHGQQNVDQDGGRRVPLAVALEVADVLMHGIEFLVEKRALPLQQTYHQQQRQEQQGSLHQTVGQLAHAGRPGQGGDLVFQAPRHGLEPLVIQRLVAGDPEHLLVQRGTQALGGAEQLFLVELQGDRFVEQCAQFPVQAFEQVAAGDRQLQQAFAQLRRVLVLRLIGQQVIHIGCRIADGFPLLVDFELVQTDVSDFVGQVAVDLQVGQGLLLLVENLGQQEAALEHADLLIQGLVALGHAVELLAGLEVLLGQFVEAVGAAQQVVGQFDVGRTFSGQHAAAAGFLCFQRLLGDRFLRLRQTLLIDQRLQVLDFLIQPSGFLQHQVVTGVAQVLQGAVTSQFLAAQVDQGADGGLFGHQLVAGIGRQRLAVVLAQLEDAVDLLDTVLAGTDLGLRAFRAGLRGDDQAVGVGQRLLQLTLFGGALAEDLLQLRHTQGRIALSHRQDRRALEAAQFALCLKGLLGGIGQLLLEISQLALVVFLVADQPQGLLEHLLQSLLVGFWQLAFGDLVEVLLHRFTVQRVGSLNAGDSHAQPQQGCGKKIAHRLKVVQLEERWAV